MLSPKAIIWSSNGRRTLRNVRQDSQGGPRIEIDSNEATKLSLDLSHYLPAGETITALDLTSLGITATGTVDSGNQSATITISNPQPNGRVYYKLTLSTGEITTDTITVQNRVEGVSTTGAFYDV